MSMEKQDAGLVNNTEEPSQKTDTTWLQDCLQRQDNPDSDTGERTDGRNQQSPEQSHFTRPSDL